MTVEYAGSDQWAKMNAAANIGINSTNQLTLTNSEITDSGEHGVYCDENPSFTESNNTFSNNAGSNINGCS